MAEQPYESSVSVRVRDADAADMPALVKLFVALEDAQRAYRVFPEVPDPVARAEAQFRAALAEPDAAILIAEAGGTPVGMAVARVHEPGDRSLADATVVELSKVVVEPGSRRSGAARALIAAAEDFGRVRGATWVAAKAFSGNAEGLEFWDRMGFVPRYEERVRPILGGDERG